MDHAHQAERDRVIASLMRDAPCPRNVACEEWLNFVTGEKGCHRDKCPRYPDMNYVHENAEAAVAALTTESSDTQIVEALANYLLVGKPTPITMSINHNAKAAPCPLRIDRPGAKASFVTMSNAAAARLWVIEALMRGYEVQVGTRRGQEIRSLANEKRSIEYRKEMAEYRARRAADPTLDDDIPF